MAPSLSLSSSAVHHHHYQQFEQQQQHQQQHHLGTDSKSPTADDSAEKKDDKSAPVRKRLSLACTTCRQRKVKCDGGRPSCRTCAKFNWPCVYQPSNRKRGPRPRALALMDGSIPYMNRSHWPASHGYYVYGFPGQSPPPPPPPQHYMTPVFGQPPDAPMNGAPVRMEASLMQPGGYNHDTYTTYGDYMTNSGSIRIRPPPPMRSPVNQSAPHMPMRAHPRQHYPHRMPGPMGMSGPPLPPPLVMPQHPHHPHHMQPPPHATRPLMQYAEQKAHGQMAGHRAQSPFSPTSSAGFSPHSGRPLYTLPEPHLLSLTTSAAPVHRYTQKLTSPVQTSPSNAGQPPLQSPIMHAQYADSRQRGAQRSDARRNDPGSALSLASASDNNTSAAVSLKLIGEGSRQMGADIVSRNTEAESEVLGGISNNRNSGGGSGGGLPSRSSLGSPAPQRMHSSAQSRDSASNYAPDMQPQSTNASMHLSAIYTKGKADITNRSVESSNGVRFAHPQPSTPADLSDHRQVQPMCVKDDSTLSLPMQRSENSRAAVETPMSVPIPSTAAFPPSRLHYIDKQQQHYRGQYQQSSIRYSLPEPEPHIVQRQEHVCSPQISPKPAPFGSGDSRPRLPPLSEVFGRDYQFMRSPDNLSLAAEVLVLPLASAGIRSEHPTPSLAHGKDSFRGGEASKMGC
ncbi:hypothetical protein LPJ66_004052 [Kickxella alabastrina]|uniref:Uncharacterized protein n=1 Tax=Kickxella alabastrina TaxID=61397 RepID=A0ACC1IJR2_9FUNG|nr:hypothetical protein LPJ66_004052 [Kickxella alabastrina]